MAILVDTKILLRSVQAEMGREVAVVLYVVAMAAVIVGVDVVFFRNRFGSFTPAAVVHSRKRSVNDAR
jgi:hypothetical protein